MAGDVKLLSHRAYMIRRFTLWRQSSTVSPCQCLRWMLALKGLWRLSEFSLLSLLLYTVLSLMCEETRYTHVHALGLLSEYPLTFFNLSCASVRNEWCIASASSSKTSLPLPTLMFLTKVLHYHSWRALNSLLYNLLSTYISLSVFSSPNKKHSPFLHTGIQLKS